MRIAASLGAGLGFYRQDTGSGETRQAADAAKPALPAVPTPHDCRTVTSAYRVRPAATLVAQLVAGADNLPAARARRRADPQSAAKLYQAMSELPAAARRRAGPDI